MAVTGDMSLNASASSVALQNPQVVFVLGVAERSGTTYLQDLLRLHPDCDVDGLELEENHFIDYSHLLTKYVQLTTHDWKAWWGQDQLESDRELLLRSIGDGLISCMKTQLVQRRLRHGIDPHKDLKVLVTKSPATTRSPGTQNFELFFRIFPDADLILLMRDGRAVVESAVHTFYRRFDKVSRQWAERADAFQRLIQNDANRGRRYLLVKYEDLYSNSDQEMRKILSFLHLDEARYPFEGATNLPVRGSSTLHQAGAPLTESVATGVAPGIHWRPVPKSASFKPLARWSQWKRAQHERFNWIAGRSLEAQGYQRKVYPSHRWLWNMRNWILDKLPIEATVWLVRKAGRELKANPNKFEALSKMVSKAARAFRGRRRLSA